MSLDRHALTFVARSKAAGVSFTRTATIGRQGLSASAADVRSALSFVGLDASIANRAGGTGLWLEPVLGYLGAEEVVSVDVSDYEGATCVHDLNTPIPLDLEESFTVVIDVGTLEHVFEFPTAIRNLMRMVEIGGHLLLVTPTNNEAGHGFYQFSPEVLFRVLSSQFGFELEEMLICEPGRLGAQWYAVRDPMIVGQRAQFRSRTVTYLFVRARRLGSVPELRPAPQQSDYVAAWKARRLTSAASPRMGSVMRSGAHAVASYATENRVLASVVDRPFGWIRRLRMFRRVVYTRLPSHFVKLDPRGPR